MKRVPLPEKELGIIGELGALGFVCLAIAAPRMAADKEIADARKLQAPAPPPTVVSEAERITAAHAAAPYANQTHLDGLRHATFADESSVDLEQAPGFTVAETHPTFIDDVDRIAREHDLTPEKIVELRQGVGMEGDLLEGYGLPTDGDGVPLSRGEGAS